MQDHQLFYNHPAIKRPNYDKFVSKSVNFTNARTVTPLCCPARRSILDNTKALQCVRWWSLRTHCNAFVLSCKAQYSGRHVRPSTRTVQQQCEIPLYRNNLSWPVAWQRLRLLLLRQVARRGKGKFLLRLQGIHSRRLQQSVQVRQLQQVFKGKQSYGKSRCARRYRVVRRWQVLQRCRCSFEGNWKSVYLEFRNTHGGGRHSRMFLPCQYSMQAVWTTERQ